MRLKVMGGPSLADRQKGGNMTKVQARSCSGADCSTETLGLDLHYGFGEERSYIANHRTYYDPLLKLFFSGGSGCCCNLVPLNEIQGRLEKILKTAEKYKTETFGGGSHEQYTFPYYPNYLPDHMQRIEAVAKFYYEHDCKPIYFSEGVLGNTAWGK
jgi:hypothetical protein